MIRKAKDLNELSPWQEMTPGGEIYEGGTSRLTITGAWRSNVPVIEWDKCKQCLLCCLYCPVKRPIRHLCSRGVVIRITCLWIPIPVHVHRSTIR